jgi:hypothetical protein
MDGKNDRPTADMTRHAGRPSGAYKSYPTAAPDPESVLVNLQTLPGVGSRITSVMPVVRAESGTQSSKLD